MDFVSWDDEIPNIWKVIKAMFQTTNQIIMFPIKKKTAHPQFSDLDPAALTYFSRFIVLRHARMCHQAHRPLKGSIEDIESKDFKC